MPKHNYSVLNSLLLNLNPVNAECENPKLAQQTVKPARSQFGVLHYP